MIQTPAISITVSSGQGWPTIRDTVLSVEAAAAAVGGEVIITDGSHNPPPDPADLAPTTTWHAVPGASIFQLRHLAYAMSAAPIVAITEDHCRVRPDWASKIIASHAAHPDATAIGGSVENGAVDSDIDWASFLVVQASIAAPIASGPADKIAGAVNTSYKREALASIDDFDGMGAMDTVHQRSLGQAGRTLVSDDSIRVIHDQSLGTRGTILIHYHAGRTFAGFLRQRMDGVAWLRFLGVFVVPYLRFARAVVLSRRKGYAPIVSRVWPAMLLLFITQGAGQLVGFLAGPGDSPHRGQ